MAHSTPNRIANKGDASRLTTAAGWFIINLVTDSRAEQQYPNWLEARRKLDAMLNRIPADKYDVALASYKPVEIREHERFVREQLHLEEWAHWVGPALMKAWECRRDGREFAIPVVIGPGTPVGKKPRAGGEDIERNVKWLYRVEVKTPPDIITDIASEYAASVNRDNDARSVVQNGIKQAKALLDIIGRDGLTDKK